ncbi:hypothetical protein K435DRAFT_99270 [Dendrothele bispora CBS 962.96]|uniref:Uncharacterized protein n=1 Tax=Dendrothele bispora (strain CBS 962.96) TaxID=1314807 RepID=A0A4S8M2F9_DENBC|nr:hypothetical protein K435DRAFT_99270 [Dendrothele bispora CBS 962.96]
MLPFLSVLWTLIPITVYSVIRYTFPSFLVRFVTYFSCCSLPKSFSKVSVLLLFDFLLFLLLNLCLFFPLCFMSLIIFDHGQLTR